MIPIKRTRGRPAARASGFELVRELTSADFGLPVPRNAGVPALARMTHRHQTAARCVATGMGFAEVAEIVGLSPQRISDMMRGDPAFQNLVATYADRIADGAIDEAAIMQRKLLIIAAEAGDEIIDRLEDRAIREMIPMSELRNLMGDALSRTVAPPKQTQPAQVSPTKIIFNVGNKILRDPGAEGAPGSVSPVPNSPSNLIEGTSKDITDADPDNST